MAGYVWDYAGRMDFLRIFWDEVVSLDPAARPRDEGGGAPLFFISGKRFHVRAIFYSSEAWLPAHTPGRA